MLVAVFVVFATVWMTEAVVLTGGDPDLPGPWGDPPDYDNIALNLARGRGFAIDYSDPEFRRPYELHQRDHDYSHVVNRHTPFQIATYRPPLLPALLALSYRVFGRNFLIWRFIQSILTALGMVFLFDLAMRAFGWRVALATLAVLLFSHSFLRYVAREGVMTEPIGASLIAVLLWALGRFSQTDGRLLFAAEAGVAFALLCLARSFYVVWIPFVALYLAWIAWKIGASRSHIARAVSLFLVVAVALPMPWWIRNCVVTGAFLPLGAPEGGALHAAYSDQAVLHHGNWWMPTTQQIENAYVHELGYSCKGCDDVQLMRYESAGARKWIVTHPWMVPKLAFQKLAITFRFADDAGAVAPLFLFALAAPLVLWRRRAYIDRRVTIGVVLFIALNFLVIAMTWTSQGWRLAVPVEPLIIMLAGVALATIAWGEERIRAD